jgi:nitroreductase
MSVIDNIKNRVSTRTYLDKPIEEEKKQELIKLVDELNEVCDHFRFELAFENEAKVELGTYGFIKGAKNYLIAMAKYEGNNKEKSFKFGHLFESFILKAQELGLGTCWMAGTYDRKQVSELVTVHDDEFVIVVTPIGYKDNMRLKEKAMRSAIQANKRKKFETIIKNFDGSLLNEQDSEVLCALTMLRLSPSAKNVQPWRVFKQDDYYHIYGTESSDYEIGGFNLSHNDVGIAFYHFTESLKHYKVKFEVLDANPEEKEKLVYMKSVKIIR